VLEVVQYRTPLVKISKEVLTDVLVAIYTLVDLVHWAVDEFAATP
jgi:hypothetical protein